MSIYQTVSNIQQNQYWNIGEDGNLSCGAPQSQNDHLSQLTRVFLVANRTFAESELNPELAEAALTKVTERYRHMKVKIQTLSWPRRLWTRILQCFSSYNIDRAFADVATTLRQKINERERTQSIGEKTSTQLKTEIKTNIKTLCDLLFKYPPQENESDNQTFIRAWSQAAALNTCNKLFLLAEHLTMQTVNNANSPLLPPNEMYLIPELYHFAKLSQSDQFYQPGKRQFQWKQIYNEHCERVKQAYGNSIETPLEQDNIRANLIKNGWVKKDQRKETYRVTSYPNSKLWIK